MEEFEWQGKDDDFICRYGNYTLRVEQMDRSLWWWRTYYKGFAISPYEREFTTSKFRAFGLAEGTCLGHMSINIEE